MSFEVFLDRLYLLLVFRTNLLLKCLGVLLGLQHFSHLATLKFELFAPLTQLFVLLLNEGHVPRLGHQLFEVVFQKRVLFHLPLQVVLHLL